MRKCYQLRGFWHDSEVPITYYYFSTPVQVGEALQEPSMMWPYFGPANAAGLKLGEVYLRQGNSWVVES
jgi:hypothetical protein